MFYAIDTSTDVVVAKATRKRQTRNSAQIWTDEPSSPTPVVPDSGSDEEETQATAAMDPTVLNYPIGPVEKNDGAWVRELKNGGITNHTDGWGSRDTRQWWLLKGPTLFEWMFSKPARNLWVNINRSGKHVLTRMSSTEWLINVSALAARWNEPSVKGKRARSNCGLTPEMQRLLEDFFLLADTFQTELAANAARVYSCGQSRSAADVQLAWSQFMQWTHLDSLPGGGVMGRVRMLQIEEGGALTSTVPLTHFVDAVEWSPQGDEAIRKHIMRPGAPPWTAVRYAYQRGAVLRPAEGTGVVLSSGTTPSGGAAGRCGTVSLCLVGYGRAGRSGADGLKLSAIRVRFPLR